MSTAKIWWLFFDVLAKFPDPPSANILLQPVSCVADAQIIWHYDTAWLPERNTLVRTRSTALITLLPTLGVKTRENEPLPAALYRSATLEPAVFYATLVGGAVQRLTLTQSSEDARVMLIAQTKTAEAVRASLAKGSVTDGTLFAIMALALKQDDTATPAPVKHTQNGFLSPV